MQSIPACQHYAERRLRRPLQIYHLLGQRSRNETDSDSLFDQPVTQRVRNGINGLVAQQVQARPCRQVGPKLPNGGIETDGRHEGRPVLGADAKNTLVPGHQLQKTAVRYFDCFRASG